MTNGGFYLMICKQSWKKFFTQLYVRFRDDNIPALSAQLTFYLLFSLFPFLLFLLNILSYTTVSIYDYTENISGFLPDAVGLFFRGLVSEMLGAKSAALLSVSALVTIWSASRGVHAISVCLNKACDATENRPFIKLSAITMFFTVCLAVMVMATLLFLIFGQVIGENLFNLLHVAQVFSRLWEGLRYIVPIGMMFLVFSLLYKYIPNCRLTFKESLPGALFSTFGWVLTSLAFSLYIDLFSGFSKIYGSIGAVILLQIWLYISSVVLLLGGEINAAVGYYRSGVKIDKYENSQIKLPFSWPGRNKKP